MTETTPISTSHPTALPTTMRAATYDRYGRPEDVLGVTQVPVPKLGPDDVLVRVAAASVNALDWHFITGLPMFARPVALGLRRPKRTVPGADVAGTVMALGDRVTRFRVGDEVFGQIDGGGFAEYVVAPAEWLVGKPQGLSLEESATLGVAAETALQGLRDWAGLRAGQTVLVNGASGGVGTFAVQLAKALGASHVTAVCSTPNVETAARLGADRVVDYTQRGRHRGRPDVRRGVRQRRIVDAARLPTPARGQRDLRDGHRAQVEVAAPAAADARRPPLLQGHWRSLRSRQGRRPQHRRPRAAP